MYLNICGAGRHTLLLCNAAGCMEISMYLTAGYMEISMYLIPCVMQQGTR